MRHSHLFALVLVAACGTEPLDDDLCDANMDADGDGLDDCLEADLGTSYDVADSDGDGLTDGEEFDCVSDPLDGEEVCYTCGWEHADPGTFTATGARVGDVIANVDLVDQCGDDVQLWDMAGEYHILWMTAAW